MDRHLARYVFTYYSHFMTKKEMLANRHLMGTAKPRMGGRTWQLSRKPGTPAHIFGSCSRTILKYSSLRAMAPRAFCRGRLSESWRPTLTQFR